VVHASRFTRTVVSPSAGRGFSSSIPHTTLWISSGMVLYRQPSTYLGGRLVTCGSDSSTRRLVVAASGGRPIKESRYFRKGKHLRGPIRPALGTADGGLSCFEVGRRCAVSLGGR